MIDSAALRARLANVRERLTRAAGRVGRDPGSIRLVAISKTFSVDHVRAVADATALRAGERLHFGENKVQEALQKMDLTADIPAIWHLVGHLQTNKAAKAGARFDCIHSVDNAALLAKLDQAAAAAGRTLELLVQVDLAGEPTKHGAREDQLEAILAAAQGHHSARVTGLMVLPPASGDPEGSRPYFRELRRIRDGLLARGASTSMLNELSMGMSHDFDVAIEEGATLVRVGTAIFGSRTAA